MSSKDKEKAKMRSFFKQSKMGGAGGSRERTLRPEVDAELRPEQPAANRCKTLKELSEGHLQYLNLDETEMARLWSLTKDLIVQNKPAEYRQTALNFYKKLILTQYKNLNAMRETFFNLIQSHEVPEDIRHRLDLLDTLTENGKNINNFEERIGKFMLHWLSAIAEANLLKPYLDILVNLIKCNAAHLENEIVVGIVQNACHLSCTVEDDDIGLLCLKNLEMVMCYTIFPTEPLPQCVVTLCRTVNHVPYCPVSYKIMKNLLGTRLGYHSMKMMCNILNDKTLYDDQQLLRGAVFHLQMNVFGPNIIFNVSPMFYATTVLTSFLHSLESRQVNVTYEVILSVRGVVMKYKNELPEIVWDLICDIMTSIVDNIDYYEVVNITKPRLRDLQTSLHESIDYIEKLVQDENSSILANYDRIYDLIERVADSRPEQSVLTLIDYRSGKIMPSRPDWLFLLNDFVRRYFKMTNPKIRIKLIDCLKHIMDLNRACYEDEILERVVVPHFNQIMYEPDVNVRVAVTKALIEFVKHCDTKRCNDILNILEKVINYAFEQYSIMPLATDFSNTPSIMTLSTSVETKPIPTGIKTEADIQDIIVAVNGLIEVFAIKLHRLPSCHAIKIFNILVGHLELHYDKPKVFEHVNIVRYQIFSWMLKARANSIYQIGYPDPEDNSVIKYSSFLGIDNNVPHQRHSVPTQLNSNDLISANTYTTLSIRRACKMIVKCLDCDSDLQIFQLVMRELPKVLKNKALIQGNDIEALAVALFKTCREGKSFFKRSSEEFLVLVLPAVAALVVHHQFLQPSHQSIIISLLTPPHFFPGIANICINTMTTVIFEMPEALMRTLPNILLTMSKMSDTTMVALPVLEFLSILSRLSNHFFANFIAVHYMYVFAISLPFTKPFRFDQYTVSLAHHVIAAWFLKCKLEHRKNIVSYIISSIQSNVKMLFDDINKLNEDSSNRKRSTSLTERGSRNPNLNSRNDSDMRPLMNDSFKTFHSELAETCIDFLARHTFSPCSALPKRLPAVEYLLKDGPSQTWLVGYNLVTITTSGCPSPPNRNGLCDQCAQLSKTASLTFSTSDKAFQSLSPEINTTPPIHQNLTERRTKVSLQHSSGNESAGSTDLTSSSSSTSTTQRQQSNSSTASLEALSRRGSNPDVTTGESAVGSSTSLLGTTLSTASPSTSLPSPSNQSIVQQPVCVRSCTGWAEILIRRATGNISWIMRIQNPISNDCFGHDIPFGNMVSLFLPTANGGIFGPNLFNNESEQNIGNLKEDINELLAPPQQANSDKFDSSRESLISNIFTTEKDEKRRVSVKARPLQRQEEISSSNSATAAIDIPKGLTSKRKEALSGSVSDGEVDDENLPFDDDRCRSRNPVRRVNSSPEMSSSWRQTLLAAKPTISSPEPLINENEEPNSQSLQQLLQKKKSVQYSTKDMRVSCEAIPEEKAGSTPPQNQECLIQSLDSVSSNKERFLTASSNSSTNSSTSTLTPRQYSADDLNTNVIPVAVVPINLQQSTSASSWKSNQNLDKSVSTKPPLSQTLAPLSPRLDKHNLKSYILNSPTTTIGVTKSNSSAGTSTLGANGSNVSNDYNNVSNDMMRGRSKTISVVREVNNGKARPPKTNFRSYASAKPAVNSKLCMNPSFVFMQLYNTGQLQITDTPLKVTPDQISKLNILDLAPPYETHKIGVLYVGQGQCNNLVEILRNSYGSIRYLEFLRNLGTLVSLKDAGQNNLFLCLDTNGADGKFSYVWKDDIVQITFHVATLMPTNMKKDPNCNEKKKHIGNDYVNIIYNESGEEYNLSTISGQFNFACVIVEPLEANTNRVYVKARQEISSFVCHPEPKIVSDRSAPLLARQLALHANLASLVYQSLQKKNPYGSNWLQRLRIIKRLRTKLIEDQNKSNQSGSSNVHSDMDNNPSDLFRRPNISRDFTKYT